MEHRWMKGVVVLFWMSTMTWLVVEKVMPPLERGDPPTFHSAYGDLNADAPAIGWTVAWNDRAIGWAASRVLHPSSGLYEVHSRVHFAHLPLEEMVPIWMRNVFRNAVTSLGSLEMDAFNCVEIDPLNRLVGFRSTIHLKKVPQAIVIEGTVEGTRLKLRIDAGDATLHAAGSLFAARCAGDRRDFAASAARRTARRPDVDGAGLQSACSRTARWKCCKRR